MKKDAKHRPITLELIELLKDEKLKEMMDDSIALARKANPNTDSNPIFQTEDLFSFIDRLDGCMPWLICPSKEYSSLYMRYILRMHIFQGKAASLPVQLSLPFQCRKPVLRAGRKEV